MKKFGYIFISLLFLVACNSSKGGNGSEGINPSNPENKPSPDPRCKSSDVEIPDDIGQLFPEGIDTTTVAGMRLPDCKTMIIAFSKNGQDFAVTRMENNKPDLTYGDRGKKIFSIFQNQWASGKVSLLKLQNTIHLMVPVTNSRSAGVLISDFDSNAEQLASKYDKGFGYIPFVKAPNSGSWCTVFSLEIKNIVPKKSTQLEVTTIFKTYCHPKPFEFTKLISTAFPEMTDLKKPIPSSCGDLNYDTPGAIDGEVHTFQPNGCSSISVKYEQLRYPAPDKMEHIFISTDGKCKKSERYGYSCFYYENDYLVREFVNQFWQPGKSYLKVFKNVGNICGTYGRPFDRIMVESPYPPTDSRFLQICNFY